VRVWDVKRNNTVGNASVSGEKGSDLLATYFTKETPVYNLKLAFTGANVVLRGLLRCTIIRCEMRWPGR
jgi:hypothetical protein